VTVNAPHPLARGTGTLRIRHIGALLLGVLALWTALGAPWTERLQSAWFDAHHSLWPRDARVFPVTVVEIDQKSLLALGQWPWPRTQLAHLIDMIERAQPLVIGIDVLMPEPDALSPERLLAVNAPGHEALGAALRGLPANDEVLAQSLRGAPTVMPLAGTPEATGRPLRSAPVTMRFAGAGGELPAAVVRHEGALTNVDVLDAQASGWGMISADTVRGVIRRMPLVASIHGTLVPSLAVEMLRVATRTPSLRVDIGGGSVTSLTVADLTVPTEPDGTLRVYFSRHAPERSVSAVDVLQGRVDAESLHGQLVIIGPTAIGLNDYQDTPIGERMSGSVIHAQLIENLVQHSWLRRPSWTKGVEVLLLVLAGAVLVAVTPRWKPRHAAALALALVVVPMGAGAALFRHERVLVDTATTGLQLVILFLGLLLLTLGDATRQRRRLEREVQAQRERAARVAGELEAAQRIQIGSLPRLDLLAGDRRVALHAVLQPAREVGGDLYDFFMLDDRRLFLLVGDVAGKGLSASIFMAVSKALYKGSMLRAPRADIGDVMSTANAEVSRDNAAMLFVTAFAAILDLETGELQYCNAGHDNPWRVPAGDTAMKRITDGDGPPLCALPDFPYRSASCRLAPGESLWLMTDGVTEAADVSGALYGAARVERVLVAAALRDAPMHSKVEALQADVQAFSAGTEPADDLTILALRWQGPLGAAA
jgi:serine phosphatase RsbU (regulator of sigma subunit)/CHASE2 domain-containing sensor protein